MIEELNAKSRYYPNKMGVNFCEYRIYETHILLRNRSKKKIKGKIREWNNLYIINKLIVSEMKLSLGSWLGHAKHANTYNMIKDYKNKIIFYQK